MRLLLATDAWHPQINGVVRTLSTVTGQIRQLGHEVEVVTPNDFPSVPLPMYPEIQVSVWMRGLKNRIDAFDPDAVHISTEGPIGQYVRRYCLKRGVTFTTSFHTRFPEYLRERVPISLNWTYSLIRNFHQPAFRTLVPTPTLRKDLQKRGFAHLQVWGRGVDTDLFTPERRRDLGLERPVMLNVGRIAPEKNLQAFLDLDLPGTKVVVGDGPSLAELQHRYPEVVFPGARHGEELADYYAAADVFVFPSLTDTFGLVMLESMASGVPVAAFPVTGPLDVVEPGVTGVLDQDLSRAVDAALQLDGERCREEAAKRGWGQIARELLAALMPLDSDKLAAINAAQASLEGLSSVRTPPEPKPDLPELSPV
jgi:glycosyltransferase involved in cell wall biosynthesis